MRPTVTDPWRVIAVITWHPHTPPYTCAPSEAGLSCNHQALWVDAWTWMATVSVIPERLPFGIHPLTIHQSLFFPQSIFLPLKLHSLIVSVLLCGPEKLFKTAHSWLCSHFFWKDASIIKSHTTFNPLLLLGGGSLQGIKMQKWI